MRYFCKIMVDKTSNTCYTKKCKQARCFLFDLHINHIIGLSKAVGEGNSKGKIYAVSILFAAFLFPIGVPLQTQSNPVIMTQEVRR